MIIAVAGLTGSGKNTLGELLAKELGYRLVCPTFKDLAAMEGIPLMEFQKRAEKDPDIDKKFDAALKEMAAPGDCVVTSWLGAWMVDADVRIRCSRPFRCARKG
jgi:cytidylate kinase